MSGLIGALLNGSQSLATQSQGVQIAGKNLANSNTPGYARQRIIVGSLGTVQTAIGAQSMGTQAVGIQQIRDKFLDVQMTREISQTGLLQAQSVNLQKAQADLGEQIDSTANATSITDLTHSTSGVSSGINDFFNAFDNLASNPTDAGAKQVLLQEADLLTNKINVADSRLEGLQSDITAQNKGDLTTVKGLLEDIASFNNQIQKVEINSQDSAADLRDQRQSTLEELAKYMDFTTRDIPDGHGQIQVLSQDDLGKDVMLVDKTSVLGEVSYNEATKEFTGGAPTKVDGLQVNAPTSDDVKGVNDLLKDIASLNTQIQAVETGAPNSATALRTQRQTALDTLANSLSFTTRDVPGANGQIQVAVKNPAGAEVVLVDRGNAGSISYDAGTSQFSGTAPVSVLSLQGGSLKGNVVSRDGAIQQLRDDIKATAQQITDSVNSAYGSSFFDATPTSGLISVNSALTINTLKTSSDGSPGGNDVATAVANVANKVHSISGNDKFDGTISSFYSRAASGFGQSVTNVESKLADQTTVEGLISAQRDSVSGVSQDEEMTDLMRYQRAFQASARVINVIDNLLDVVVNSLGR